MYPEGGYRFITAGELVGALNASNCGAITFAGLKAYLGCVELLARREGARSARKRGARFQPCFTISELASLLRFSRRSTQEALLTLEKVGLLTFSEKRIELTPAEDCQAELLGGRSAKRRVPLPRRLIRFLCRSRKASLVKTVIAYLLRGLSITREGDMKAVGTIKVSWICRLCGLSERAVRLSRAELIRLGWISRDEGSTQLKLNRDGAYFRINLSWEGEGRGLNEVAPREAKSPVSFAPPEKKQGSPIGSKNQELDSEAAEQLAVCAERQEKIEALSSGVCAANERKRTTEMKPTLKNVRPDDLRRVSRLKELFTQAVKAGWLPGGEASLQNFVAAAVRATRVKGDSVRIFIGIVRRGLWHHIAKEDEDRARMALRREAGISRSAQRALNRIGRTLVPPPEPGLRKAEESLSSCISYLLNCSEGGLRA